MSGHRSQLLPEHQILGLVAGGGCSPVALVVRYPRARGTERQQLNWLAFAVAAVALVVAVGCWARRALSVALVAPAPVLRRWRP
jgi:hypothetical protein